MASFVSAPRPPTIKDPRVEEARLREVARRQQSSGRQATILTNKPILTPATPLTGGV